MLAGVHGLLDGFMSEKTGDVLEIRTVIEQFGGEGMPHINKSILAIQDTVEKLGDISVPYEERMLDEVSNCASKISQPGFIARY